MNLARGSRLVVGLRTTVRVIPLMACCRFAWGQAESTLPRPLLKQESEADRAFFEAKQKAAEQKWAESLRLFERAYNLKPSYDIAGNLGQVALKLELYAKAATYLDRCLHWFPATGSTTQRSQVEGLFREASIHVAAVRFRSSSSSGELVLDRMIELGSVRGPVATVYVNPGTHVIQVRQGGRVVVERSFLAVANVSQQVNVGIGDSATDASHFQTGTGSAGANSVGVRVPDSGEASGTRGVLPIVAGAGISLASFVAAGALLHSASTKKRDAYDYQSKIPKSTDPAHGPCLEQANAKQCGELRDAWVRVDKRYNWGYAMLGVGGVSLAATLAYGWWALNHSQPGNVAALDRQMPFEIRVTPRELMLRAAF